MKLRTAGLEIYVGYEAAAAMTAVLLLDRDNRVLACFAAALLHEAGHILMIRLCGVRLSGLRLRLFDVLIEADEPPTFRADVLITLGGAAMNLIRGAALCPFSLRWGVPHLVLGLFNLLPVMSLDGGHLLSICLLRRVSVRAADIAVRVTTVVFILPLMTAGLYMLLSSGYNYSLLLTALYLAALLLLKH